MLCHRNLDSKYGIHGITITFELQIETKLKLKGVGSIVLATVRLHLPGADRTIFKMLGLTVRSGLSASLSCYRLDSLASYGRESNFAWRKYE